MNEPSIEGEYVRLRAENTILRARVKYLEGEVERLTENNWPWEWEVATKLREENKELKAEIKRLRHAYRTADEALNISSGAD